MENASKIPSEKDWVWENMPKDYYQGDVRWAREKFFGHTIDEMLPRFVEFPLSASENLSYMPKVPFQFYVMAFKKLFMTEEGRAMLLHETSETSDLASTFLKLLINKLRKEPDHIIPIMDELLPVAEYVAMNQSLFDARIDTYGSFPERLQQIRDRVNDCLSSDT